jgi:fluoride ion exporter CrcB/FEX
MRNKDIVVLEINETRMNDSIPIGLIAINGYGCVSMGI